MRSFSVSLRAKADLDEIWTYLAEHSDVATADRVLESIQEAFAMIDRQPEIGSRVGDRSPGLRFVIAGQYVVLYDNQSALPRIRRVMHGARDLSDYFGSEESSS